MVEDGELGPGDERAALALEPGQELVLLRDSSAASNGGSASAARRTARLQPWSVRS